jgi:hypothetical protein
MVGRAEFLNKAVMRFYFSIFKRMEKVPEVGITFGYLESQDAKAAVQWLREKLPEEKIAFARSSHGGAAAYWQNRLFKSMEDCGEWF